MKADAAPWLNVGMYNEGSCADSPICEVAYSSWLANRKFIIKRQIRMGDWHRRDVRCVIRVLWRRAHYHGRDGGEDGYRGLYADAID